MDQPKSVCDIQNGFSYEPTDEDLWNLREWLKKVPYLPQDFEDHELATVFRMSKGSLERTKHIIDKFFEGRIKYPEIFLNWNPLSAKAQLDMDISIKVPLPKKTDDGCFVIVTKIKDNVPADADFDPIEIFRMYAMVFEVLFMENKCGSGRVVLITDVANVKLGHIKKFSPNLVMTVLSVLTSAFPYRVAAMHAVHLPQFAEWIVNLGKSVLKTKLANRIHVHSSNEDLLKFYSKKILPSDFGGEEESLQKLQDEFRKKLESYAPKFIEREKMLRTLDKLRLASDDVMVGSFRNLQVD